jgi:hypothetical protein
LVRGAGGYKTAILACWVCSTVRLPSDNRGKSGRVDRGAIFVNVLFAVPKLGGDTPFADGVCYGGGAGGFAVGLAPVAAAKAAAALKDVKVRATKAPLTLSAKD